ncbi:dihydroorotate dehydrogenase (fumarate) [[Emmonsia] crescens]|uniref:Dihydroorotate dehydrogenase (Fumarate) n=1 Tax=[Emmonsia] crescens TaxID=73230 RepID=A0A0G2HZU8_9EURO|nr:dihydroorotate dehydrogenase (fumarate) [Emmonsia crescens UAMH 3008]
MTLNGNGRLPRSLLLNLGAMSRARAPRHPRCPIPPFFGQKPPVSGSNLRFGSRSTSSTSSASSVSEAATESTKPAGRKLKRYFLGTSIVFFLWGGYLYATDTRASAHRWIVPRLIRWYYPDAEDAHHAGVNWLKFLYRFGLHPRERGNPDGDGKLVTEVFGYTLCNPIGISGGLDKDAEIPSALFELGPAIVEVGGTTPLPQEGNPRSRVFRIVSQNALINRYGLNSKGADHMAAVLKQRVREFAYAHGFGSSDPAEQRVLNGEAGVPPGSLTEGKLLAVQIAKNKGTPEADIEAVKKDYVYCVDRLGKYADILVVNVSSPNTPGLRTLQESGPLTALLKGVVEAAKHTNRKAKPYVMVKVSPDEDTDEQISGICDAIWASGVDGVIVGNTTKARPEALPKGYKLSTREEETLRETGGFSGPHLFNKTVSLITRYRTVLDKKLKSDDAPDSTLSETGPTASPATSRLAPKVIFASGGITNGEQAAKALKAGANVAMLYTGLIYGGSGTITRMKEEMRELEEKAKG